MKFSIENIGGLSNLSEKTAKILVSLKGEDGSSHGIWVAVTPNQAKSMTIGQIEKSAIEQAYKNFSECR